MRSERYGVRVGGICVVWVRGSRVRVRFRVFWVVVFLLFVGDLCPFFGFVVYWVWLGRERVSGGEVVEFP